MTRATSAQLDPSREQHRLQDDPEGGLQAEHAERGLGERVLLVVPGVRGVVGGHRVDRAVGQPVPQRLDVLARAAAAD